jgi:hypothetical protein
VAIFVLVGGMAEVGFVGNGRGRIVVSKEDDGRDGAEDGDTDLGLDIDVDTTDCAV